MKKIDIAFIGGSGLYNIPEIKNIKWKKVKTNFGKVSSEIGICKIGNMSLAFLPRHGKYHNISPTKITRVKFSVGLITSPLLIIFKFDFFLGFV